MKKSLFLPALIIFSLLLPVMLSGQLTGQQRTAINLYMDNTPSLSKYGKGAREKVLDDFSVISDVQACWEHLRKYASLRKSRSMEDLRSMYSELGAGVPDDRDKLIPDFKKMDYLDMLEKRPGNDILIGANDHLAILDYYTISRRMTGPKDAFGSMFFIHPELVLKLRQAASADIGKKATDAQLTLWLEIHYWKKMRQDAVKRIIVEEIKAGKLVESCLSTLPGKLEAAADKEENTEQEWNGTFSTPALTLKFERKNQFAFGTGENRAGGASESVQWNLTIMNGGRAEGDWTVVFVNNDFTITRTGTVKVNLDGDNMHFDMIGTDWKIQWNEGVKRYEVYESAKSIVGVRSEGDFKRKK